MINEAYQYRKPTRLPIIPSIAPLWVSAKYSRGCRRGNGYWNMYCRVYSDDVFANVIINEESILSDDSELETKAHVGEKVEAPVPENPPLKYPSHWLEDPFVRKRVRDLVGVPVGGERWAEALKALASSIPGERGPLAQQMPQTCARACHSDTNR